MSKPQPSRKVICFVRQYPQVAGGPASIAHVRKPGRVLSGERQLLLLLSELPVLTIRSEEHTSELQSRPHLVCRLLLEKKKARSMFVFATASTHCAASTVVICRQATL